MPTGLTFEIAHTALLIMDCQAGIVSACAKDDFIERASSVVRAARSVGMTAIHIQAGFRPGLPTL
jgi:nicotinamidase-related amidase